MPNDHVKGAGAANEFDKYKAKKTGISVGLAKGHVVTKRAVVRKAPRKNYGKTNKRLQNIRAVVREVAVGPVVSFRTVQGDHPVQHSLQDVRQAGVGSFHIDE